MIIEWKIIFTMGVCMTLLALIMAIVSPLFKWEQRQKLDFIMSAFIGVCTAVIAGCILSMIWTVA